MTPGSGSKSGKLKIYLGYAAGVGKTYQMLSEAQELARQGCDIVVGYFEPHGRADTIAKTEGLEMIPRKQVEYRGSVFEEMDTDAILRRHPEICAVDEFPHTNVPGSERAKRWEDVNVLLDAGIDVLTTMNIQHLESLNDQIWQISGIRVRETIPDWVVKQADQVVMVDVTPQALHNRLMRGVVYAPDKAQRALENFFQESTLVALRELAMRQTAHESELHSAGAAPASKALPSGRAEKIAVLITDDPSSAMVIRRARRVADYLRTECIAVAVPVSGDPEALERHLGFARSMHIETGAPETNDAAGVVAFARAHGVTHLFLARPKKLSTFRPGLEQQIANLSNDLQIILVADRTRTAGSGH